MHHTNHKPSKHGWPFHVTENTSRNICHLAIWIFGENPAELGVGRRLPFPICNFTRRQCGSSITHAVENTMTIFAEFVNERNRSTKSNDLEMENITNIVDVLWLLVVGCLCCFCCCLFVLLIVCAVVVVVVATVKEFNQGIGHFCWKKQSTLC